MRWRFFGFNRRFRLCTLSINNDRYELKIRNGRRFSGRNYSLKAEHFFSTNWYWSGSYVILDLKAAVICVE